MRDLAESLALAKEYGYTIEKVNPGPDDGGYFIRPEIVIYLTRTELAALLLDEL